MKCFALEIIKEKSEYNTFNIYNEPKGIDKISYLKFLLKLNLEDYKFSFSFVKEACKAMEYQEIIDLIMEIGKMKYLIN